MKICPECKRTFNDDLSFCLEDGTPLVSQRSGDATLVYPEPPRPVVDPPRPPPTSSPVTTSGSNKSLIAVILGVLGTLLIVLIWGGIKLGLWYLDHNQNSNQNANSYVAGASPSPGTTPLSLLNGSPSPTPSVVQNPSPGPSNDESQKGVITPGTYEWIGTRAIDQQHNATLRMRVTVNGDGTYLQQVYFTFPEKGLDKLLGMEEKGRFSQSGDLLLTSDRKAHEFDFATGEWNPWKIPDDGSSSREKIRNVEENAFELYDNSERTWVLFIKVLNLGNLDR